jgi:hypothetical protein
VGIVVGRLKICNSAKIWGSAVDSREKRFSAGASMERGKKLGRRKTRQRDSIAFAAWYHKGIMSAKIYVYDTVKVTRPINISQVFARKDTKGASRSMRGFEPLSPLEQISVVYTL